MAPWLRRFPAAVFIRADGQWHYATFFYESAWCLAVVAALLAGERKRLFRRDGQIFAAYVFLYALERALVEGLRTDSLYLGGLRASQLLSLAALTLCAAVAVAKNERKGWPAACLACCLGMGALLLAGHPLGGALCAAGALACGIAGFASEGREQGKG